MTNVADLTFATAQEISKHKNLLLGFFFLAVMWNLKLQYSYWFWLVLDERKAFKLRMRRTSHGCSLEDKKDVHPINHF